MRRALLFPLVALVSLSLAGLMPVPRVITMEADGAMACHPAVGEDATCAMSCGGCPTAAGDRNAESACHSEEIDFDEMVTPGPDARTDAAMDWSGDNETCVCCVCGIGVPASAPALLIPGECSLEDARPVHFLTSVDREPTSPPPERHSFVA